MVNREEVIEALQEMRPFLQRDGGDVEFVDVDDEGVVSVRLLGACDGCPIAVMTLKGYIESMLAERVDGVTEVVQVD